jgi:proline iminopeptidase
LTKDYGTVYEKARIGNYSEGYVKVMGYWLFYRSFGELGKRGIILAVHGGPGGSQDGMTKIAKFVDDGFRVVMYDQLGSGKSERPASELLYSMERYVDEIEGVRQTLNLGRVHMYGVSFGGFLNIGYAVKYSKNLASLMTQSGTCSSPLAIKEMMRLRSEAPGWVPETMDKCEAVKDFHNPDYLKAVDYLYRQHLCRLDPLPPDIRFFPLQTRLEEVNPVYRLMWGLHEFYPTGNSKYWDVTDQLSEIECPTLVTCGRYDEITPKNAELLHERIRGSKLHIFEGCSHMPILEDEERFFDVHRDFLKQVA